MSEVKILVIEDNEESRQIIKDSLEANGFPVDVASDGEIGINKIRFSVEHNKPYTLIITDVMLPKLSGIDVLKRAKAISSELGVLVISAFDEVDPFIKKEAITNGAYAFISKPIQPSKLLGLVREYLSSKKIKRDITSSAEIGTTPFFGTTTRKTTRIRGSHHIATPPPGVEGSEIEPAPIHGQMQAPPPPPSVDSEHITEPVPDAEHFKDISGPEDLTQQDSGALPYSVTKCPMCSHLIKISKDIGSGKIWCSNCGILFDRVDIDVSEELISDAPPYTDTRTPFPPPSDNETVKAGTDIAQPEATSIHRRGWESESDETLALSGQVDYQQEDTTQQEREGYAVTARQPMADEGDIPQAQPMTQGGTEGQVDSQSPGEMTAEEQGATSVILIVEDDAHAAEILQTALDVAGYGVEIAESGTEGYEKIMQSISNNTPYMLVISDVMLPGINGLDLMKRIKEVNRTVDFILVSAYEDENLSLQGQAEAEGALKFYSKPYDYKDIIRFIAMYRNKR